LESTNRGRRRGIGEEPIAEGSSVRVRVREVRRTNVVVDGDEELRARRWLCPTSLEAMFKA